MHETGPVEQPGPDFRKELVLQRHGAELLHAVAPALRAQPPARYKLGPSTLVGIPSFGIERPLARAGRSFQWDLTLSPWQSVEGYPFQFLLGVGEWRRYRQESREGVYGALHLGAAIFRLRRPDYRDTTLYQEGAGLLGGASIGYVTRLRGGWQLDAYLGGGTIQSLYKGYDKRTGARYDGAKLWNVSGEWFPYRAGVQVAVPMRHR